MPKLVVTQGPTSGLEYPVRNELVLGRDPLCQVLISQRDVSGQHARITRVGDRYFLEDLGSRNGTLLNGKAVQRQYLSDGDEVRIGRTAFRFDGRPLPEQPHTRVTDPNSLTLELDATRDVLPAVPPPRPGAQRAPEQILKLLCDISRTVGSQTGLKAALDEIAAALLEVFPQTGRVIILLSSDGVSLEPLVTRWRHTPDALAAPYSETVVRRALTEKRAILVVDALTDDRFAHSRSVVDLQLRSLMVAPIVHREQVLGVVELDTLDPVRTFAEPDLNLMTGVVAQVAFAVANARLFDDLNGLVGGAVQTLTTALRFKSPLVQAHSERVTRYALMVARRLQLSAEALERLEAGAMLHDVGFLAVPDSALPVPGRISLLDQRTVPEMDLGAWNAIQSHPTKGAELLAGLRPLGPVVDIVLNHHEHFDGKGYPRGLAGDEIPLGARVVAVADAFDAMTSPLYYRLSLEPAAALEALKARAGSQFDPQLVAIFAQVWEARARLEARRAGD